MSEPFAMVRDGALKLSAKPSGEAQIVWITQPFDMLKREK
jgi:hypothetical protein